MTATTTNRSRTTRKVLGSLGIIGAAAAVAGMGTFGTFTDSTAPLNASVTTGTLSLDLNAANSTATLPMNVVNFVPGDSVSRSIDLVNSGDLDFAGLELNSVATTSSKLDTDKVNGLKLSVKSCSAAWTEVVSGTVATYTCSGTTTDLSGTVPAASRVAANTVASMTAGGIDHLLLTLSLPTTAGNEFQGQTTALSVNFTGTQKTGTTR